jgi:hypothetical protein
MNTLLLRLPEWIRFPVNFIHSAIQFLSFSVSQFLSISVFQYFSFPSHRNFFLPLYFHDRHSQPSNPQLQHEPGTQQKHKTRIGGKEVFARRGFSLSSAYNHSARQARHGTSQIQNRYFHSWLFLARPQRVQLLYTSQNPHRMVVAKD